MMYKCIVKYKNYNDGYWKFIVTDSKIICNENITEACVEYDAIDGIRNEFIHPPIVLHTNWYDIIECKKIKLICKLEKI